MDKNIIVVSHRRSGTHLTIDTVRNNFSQYKKVPFFTLSEKNIDDLKNVVGRNIVVKTHFLPDFQKYGNSGLLDELFKSSHIVYVYRNGLDVMVSLYEYMKKYDTDVREMNFNKFLLTNNNFEPYAHHLNRFQFWAYHIEQWQLSKFSGNILWLKYEDFLNDYESTVRKIGDTFSLSLPQKIVDVRLTSSQLKNRRLRKWINYLRGVKTTSVLARKGVSGDYKNYFDEISLRMFFDENEHIMKKLGYI